jgi:hypothetical protein
VPKSAKVRTSFEVTLVELDEYWCSDCRASALFERVGIDAGGTIRGEWACINCGAAYMDAIDLGVEVTRRRNDLHRLDFGNTRLRALNQ